MNFTMDVSQTLLMTVDLRLEELTSRRAVLPFQEFSTAPPAIETTGTVPTAGLFYVVTD